MASASPWSVADLLAPFRVIADEIYLTIVTRFRVAGSLSVADTRRSSRRAFPFDNLA